MTVVAYSDASCGHLCGWGGVVCSPDGSEILTCGGALPGTSIRFGGDVRPHIAEARAAARVAVVAFATWPDHDISLHVDCYDAAWRINKWHDREWCGEDDYAGELFTQLARAGARVNVSWVSRETDELELCDALSRVACASPQFASRLSAAQHVYHRIARVLDIQHRGPWSFEQARVVRLLHRTRASGTRTPHALAG